jgi:hypothetical protein
VRLLLVAVALRLPSRATHHQLAIRPLLQQLQQQATDGRQLKMQQTQSSAGCTGAQRSSASTGSSMKIARWLSSNDVRCALYG